MTQEQIIEKANEMVAKGAKMTFEQIVAMYTKNEAKSTKKAGSAKAAAKWTSRENVAKVNIEGSASDWLAAKNLENAKNNLPSSMK
jgi:hypothetical protein